MVGIPDSIPRRRNTRSLGRLIIRLPVRFHHLHGLNAILARVRKRLLVLRVSHSVVVHVPVVLEVLSAVRAVRCEGVRACLASLLGRRLGLPVFRAVEERVAVETHVLVLEGADHPAGLGWFFFVGFGVATRVRDGDSRGGSGLRSLILPRELMPFLAAELATGLFGGHEVVEAPLSDVARLGASGRGLLLHLPLRVVAANIEVTESVRVRSVGKRPRVLSSDRFVVIEKTVRLEVLARAYLGHNRPSLGRRRIQLFIGITIVTHEELLVVTRRGLRRGSRTRRTNRLRSLIARRQEIGQRFGRVGVLDASLARRGDRSRLVLLLVLLLFLFGRWRRGADSCGFGRDRRFNQSSLVVGVANGPGASARADNLDLSQQRRLIPVDANILNVFVAIEADDMDLQTYVVTC